MILNSPYISGSLTVTGNTNLIGSLTVTGSLAGTATSSSFAYTASSAVSAYTASSAVNATTALTASYANTFTVGGTLTAQTLVVQTITSSVSYITGSTRFGSLSTNTHTFTGSLYITGSVGINAASSFRFNGVADTSHAVGYDSTVDGAFLRGQNGIRFLTGTGGGTEIMRISGSGNVGIGVTNPSVDLEVLNTIKSRTQIYIGNNSANSKLEFQTGGSTNYTGVINTNSNVDFLNINGGAGASYDSGSGIGFMGADRYGTKTAGVLTLFAGNAVNNTAYGFINLNTANTERMRITYAGNVAIGANGTTNVGGFGSTVVTLQSPNSTYATLELGKATASFSSNLGVLSFFNGANGDVANIIGVSEGANNSGALRFLTNLAGAGATERMRVTSDGNIGIGISTPVHKIQVSGSYGDTYSCNAGGIIRSYASFTTTLGSTVDVFRFLKQDGTVFANGGVSGHLYINAQDSGTGGNQISYIYTVFTTGNGTSQASITQIYAGTLRGTNPTNGTFSLANDGAGGAVKIQTTVAGSGVSGLRCFATFVGVAV